MWEAAHLQPRISTLIIAQAAMKIVAKFVVAKKEDEKGL